MFQASLASHVKPLLAVGLSIRVISVVGNSVSCFLISFVSSRPVILFSPLPIMSSLDRALQRYYLKLFDIGHQKWCLFKPQTTKRQACIRRRAIKEEETAEIAELLNRMHAKLCSHDSAGNAELRGILRQFIRATACCVHAYSVVKDGKLLERTVLKVLKTLEDGGPFRIAEKVRDSKITPPDPSNDL